MTATAQAPELFQDSPESTSAIYTALYNAARPTVKAYINDLIKHDRTTIENNPGTPFIFGARETGTGLTLLLPDMETYERNGLKVGQKYLFGYIETERQKREIMYNQAQQVIYKPMENKLFYYYDGTRLKKSTRDQCEEIHRAHIDKVIREHDRKAAKPEPAYRKDQATPAYIY